VYPTQKGIQAPILFGDHEVHQKQVTTHNATAYLL